MTKKELLKNRRKLIKDIRKKCKENNVTLILRRGDSVKYPGFKKKKISGYFQNNEKNAPAVLASSIKGKTGLGVLLHESSHMDQWLEDHKTWTYTIKNDHDNIFDEWLQGKRVSKQKISEAVRWIRSCELDCEKRAVKKLKKYKIGISEKQYIKAANCYIYLYTFMLHSRIWPKVAPNKVKEIMDIMPDKFLKRYDRMPKKMFDLYSLYCSE